MTAKSLFIPERKEYEEFYFTPSLPFIYDLSPFPDHPIFIHPFPKIVVYSRAA
jgi:hypothetical protein